MTKGTKIIVAIACSIAVLSSAGSAVYAQKVQQDTQQAIAIIRQEKEAAEQLRAEAELAQQKSEAAKQEAEAARITAEETVAKIKRAIQEEYVPGQKSYRELLAEYDIAPLKYSPADLNSYYVDLAEKREEFYYPKASTSSGSNANTNKSQGFKVDYNYELNTPGATDGTGVKEHLGPSGAWGGGSGGLQ